MRPQPPPRACRVTDTRVHADVEDGLKSAISSMSSPSGLTFANVGDPESFWEWMMTALVPAVYNSQMYNGDTMNPYEKNCE